MRREPGLICNCLYVQRLGLCHSSLIVLLVFVCQSSLCEYFPTLLCVSVVVNAKILFPLWCSWQRITAEDAVEAEGSDDFPSHSKSYLITMHVGSRSRMQQPGAINANLY